MNTNVSPSNSDLNDEIEDAVLDSSAKEIVTKEQNAELLKKYVATHSTPTSDVDEDTTDIYIHDFLTSSENQSIDAECENAIADNVICGIESLATIALEEVVAQDNLAEDNTSQAYQNQILEIGIAKFNELAGIAGVEDINFDVLIKKKKFSLFCKRALDIVGSFIGLTILSPLLILVALLIVCTSKGGVFYRQTRVGKGGKEFRIFKFRTMYKGSDKKGLALTTSCDCRITKIGKILRKVKIDELPQLINVLIGQMSFVGYRPEVPKYVAMYTDYQMNVLRLRPGITGLASIEYRNQDEVLAAAEDVETVYIKDVMQKKLVLNIKYMLKAGFWYDIKLILKTLRAIFK